MLAWRVAGSSYLVLLFRILDAVTTLHFHPKAFSFWQTTASAYTHQLTKIAVSSLLTLGHGLLLISEEQIIT